MISSQVINRSTRLLARWLVLSVGHPVSYTISSSNHQVRSRTISVGAFLKSWLLSSRYNSRLQLLRYNGSRPRIYNHVACRRTGASSRAHNAIDDSARSLTGVGLTLTVTVTPTVHRHRLDMPLPTRAPLKPGLAWLTRQWLGRTTQD